MGLSKKQKAFVEHYKGDPIQAAIDAGYSVKNARFAAEDCLTSKEVRNALGLGPDDQSLADFNPNTPICSLPEMIKDRLNRQIFWASVMADRFEPTALKLKASEYLAKSCGDFADADDSRETLQLPNVIVIKAGKDEGNDGS